MNRALRLALTCGFFLVVGTATAIAVAGAEAISKADSEATPPPGPIASDALRVGDVSVLDAQAAVEKLLPPDARGDLGYVTVQKYAGHRVLVFVGTEVHAFVDASDGHVEMLTLPAPLSGPQYIPGVSKSQPGTITSVSAVVTADQAKTIAEAYLQSIGSPTEGMAESVRQGTDAGTTGYVVSFQRFVRNIEVPDYRRVEVDGTTGQVFSLVDVRLRFADPGSPSVTLAQAESIAVGTIGGGHAGESHLILRFDDSGVQELVWLVEVVPDIGSSKSTLPLPTVIVVDARSGAILDPTQ
jgi:hypothetical protein